MSVLENQKHCNGSALRDCQRQVSVIEHTLLPKRLQDDGDAAEYI